MSKKRKKVRKKKKNKSKRKGYESSHSGGGGGMMTNMRGGFKNIASSVVGKPKKKGWFDVALNIIFVLLMSWFIYKFIYLKYF
jgi:hypothetical protein